MHQGAKWIAMAAMGVSLLWCQGEAAAPNKRQAGSGIVWHSDVTVAKKVTREKRLPMLVFVTRQDCYYCTKMKQSTYADRDVIAEVHRSFVPVQMSGAGHEPAVQKLGIQLYPTTVLLSPEGEVLDVITGYVPVDELKPRLEAAAGTVRTAGLPKKTTVDPQ